MINFNDYVSENKTKHNKNWPYTPDHSYRILIIGGSGSVKTNVLLNLIENQPDIDKIYLYATDPYEAKYQYLINKKEGVGINHISTKDFENIYRKCTAEPYSFFVNDNTSIR